MNPPTRINRRRLLKGIAAAGLVAAGLRSGLLPAAEEPRLSRPIPKSGEALPAVGLGTYISFDVSDNPAEREPVVEVLRLFVEHGGTVLDSSPMYGRAEGVAGALAERLGVLAQLFLATKVWTRGEEAGVAQMQRSMSLLRKQPLDLMQVHNLVDWQVHLRTLRAWKEEGRIRYLGITHYHRGAYEELERILKSEDLDFLQINYSLGEPEAGERLLPLAAERGVAVLVNRPYAQGSLFGRVRGRSLPDWATEFDCRSWGQFFLKWILADPAVTCVIPATGNPRHLVDNMGAGLGRLPDAAQRRRMAELLRI